MGYYTRFTGEIRIEPPLTWAEFKDSPFHPRRADDDNLSLKLDVDEETVDTDAGLLVRREAVAVVPVTDDSIKAYEIEPELQRLVDAHPGHEFVGFLCAEGEQAGDIWRLQVDDGRATRVVARVVWPDGTEEPQR